MKKFINLSILINILFCCYCKAQTSLAQTDTPDEKIISDEIAPTGLVEVDHKKNPTRTYLEKRGSSSFVFGFAIENLYPDKYQSQIGTQDYVGLFGETSFPMYELDVGYKKNFSFGAIMAELKYGSGFIKDDRIGSLTTLRLTKKAIVGTVLLDTLFNEPYVVPYFSGEVFSYDYSENNLTTTISGSTAYTTGYSVGVLLGLGWIDQDSADMAYVSGGMTNVYLDLFVSQQNTSGDSNDPDFQSGFNYGAGIKFEF